MDTITCRICKLEQAADQFAFKNKAKGIRTYLCRSCRPAYARKYYLANPAKAKLAARKHTTLKKQQNRELIFDYLLQHPCIDCGESNPVVLEFDHIDPSSKKEAVTTLAGRGCSTAQLVTEIAKCEVRCANCHRIKTCRQCNSIRHQRSQRGSPNSQ